MDSQPYLPFFTRNDLVESDKDTCDKVVGELYPTCRVEPASIQGYCSYTLFLSPHGFSNDFNPDAAPSQALQFRPTKYSLDTNISAAAKTVYGDYAPTTVLVTSLALPSSVPSAQAGTRTLLLYEIERIPGVPYSSYETRRCTLSPKAQEWQERLVTDFARFVTRAWPPSSFLRSWQRYSCTGKIGSTIRERLQKLAQDLPTPSLRLHAQSALEELLRLDDLPVVLAHGDVVTSNIMVDAASGRLCGLVDWAEAEYLPFGMCLYGLEYLLGYLARSPVKGFRYYTCAETLRQAFWEEVCECVPELRCSKGLRSAVELSRDVGVLLWHGFAWDDGAIERVVNAEDDDEELMFLQAFLELTDVTGSRL
ncbi:hypothetical protein H2201_008440 [Coniosporium apollinis]|uniref:Aminoglycoside phosphotransferase domain-containing protein n=1 Tax=Coniosporium apollinis TaxID=61459 RepID=A0ABQ9NGN1_9PEZI|nr:hypothetical protein H2201_008440 [Coniosporium apollinis]